MKFDRRRTLQLLAGAAAMPTLARRAGAQNNASIPLRLLHIDLAGGFRHGSWEPSSSSNAPVIQPSDWQLGSAFRSLQPYKARISQFVNLDMVSNSVDPIRGANAHRSGSTHQLTATNRQSPDAGGGTSIDQLIAQRLNATAQTQLPSLEVSGREHGSGSGGSYTGPGQRVPYETNPVSVFDRLWPEGEAPAPSQDARRRMMSTLVTGEFERLLARLGQEERARIEQMRDMRADLASRRGLQNPTGHALPRTVLDAYGALDDRWRQGRPDNRRWNVKVDTMSELVAAALHADITRVATLSIGTPPDYEWGYTNGMWGTSDWHDLDHKVSGSEPNLTRSDARDAIDWMQRLKAEKVAAMLDLLSSLRESDGSTLLEHTVVLTTSHIAEGSHDLTRLPWMLIGDAHGRLRPGRLVRFDRVQDPRRSWRTNGRPHNDLFVTVARAMGISISTFGNPDVCTGPIQELLI